MNTKYNDAFLVLMLLKIQNLKVLDFFSHFKYVISSRFEMRCGIIRFWHKHLNNMKNLQIQLEYWKQRNKNHSYENNHRVPYAIQIIIYYIDSYKNLILIIVFLLINLILFIFSLFSHCLFFHRPLGRKRHKFEQIFGRFLATI